MIIDIITIFPDAFNDFLNTSIVKRAIDRKKVVINICNLRDYSHNKHNKIDDTPYGGGAGMLMAFPPFYDVISRLRTPTSKVIFLSPQGKLLNQEVAKELVLNDHLILLCGHYEGIDARIYEIIDYEISIGDYILTGGEIPAMILSDVLVRLIPSVINEESKEDDSLQNGLLKYPQYTKPETYKGYTVPSVLVSGNHKEIEIWRNSMSLKNTFLKRPDLLEKKELTNKQKDGLKSIKKDLESSN